MSHQFRFKEACRYTDSINPADSVITVADEVILAERKKGRHPKNGKPISTLLNHAECLSDGVDLEPIDPPPEKPAEEPVKKKTGFFKKT